MTKVRFLFIILGIMLISFALMPVASAVPSGYTLVKADEFNGSSLDTGLWIPYYLESRTTADRAAARYSFRDGCLVLRIDQNQPTYYSGQAMKVSSIQTGQRNYLHKDEHNHNISTIMNYTPKYGYFEIRAKTTNQRGYHCAFWTVGRRDTSTQEAEIDIFEQYKASNGDSRYRFNLIHWDDPNTSDNTYDVALNITSSTEFHTYGLEWTSTSLKFYVDGSLKRTVNQSPNYGMVFFLSIYENSGWTGTADTTASLYPREFIIDYFRAYSNSGSGGTTTLYEAEDLTRTLSSGVGSEVWNDGASGGGWVKLLSDSTGDYVDFTVNVPASGAHIVTTGYRSASSRGIAQLSINGTDHGSAIDMYQSTATFKEASTGVINFSSAGNKTFRYRVTGKNSSSSDYTLGIDYIKLVKQ